jgi:hypothetical protein
MLLLVKTCRYVDVSAVVCLVAFLGCMQELVRSFLSTYMHPLRRIALLTPRYSGSDLLEVCKQAARHCVLEHVKRSPLPSSASSILRRDGFPSSETSLSGAANGQVGNGVIQKIKSAVSSVQSVLSQQVWSGSAQQAEDTKAKTSGKDGIVLLEGELYEDADASVCVERPQVAGEAQLSEAALIKCVSEVCCSLNRSCASW